MNEIINNTPEVVETMAETAVKSGGQFKVAAGSFGVGLAAGFGIAKLAKLAKQKLTDHKEKKTAAKIHRIDADVIDAEFEDAED